MVQSLICHPATERRFLLVSEKTNIHRVPQPAPIQMYRGLLASGTILAVFGVFLVALDFYVPMGVSIFGLPIAIAGAIMVAAGFLRTEPSSITPDPGKKFCWYCMKQIPEDSTECPNCSLPQHNASD
jgi:hypothetical protein